MFKIIPNPTFKAEVKLSVPGQAPATLDIEFRHKGRAQLNAWLENAAGKTDADLLNEIIVGWSGVEDDKGQEIDYSVEALEQMLNSYPAAAHELLHGYVRALTESRLKN